jgi:catechol 2,3-dioxygenase-like lactoylglutathione lyase family enzyme
MQMSRSAVGCQPANGQMAEIRVGFVGFGENVHMTVPALNGIHHLKVHVTDVRRSARWYARVLGYRPMLEFVEGDRLVGYGLDHPNGGTVLTLRLDPEQAAKTAGWVYFEMGVPDKEALEQLAVRLDECGEHHGPVVKTPIGWLLPGLFDPDGHEVRFYFSSSGSTLTEPRPRRVHDAGPNAWIEELDALDL